MHQHNTICYNIVLVSGTSYRFSVKTVNEEYISVMAGTTSSVCTTRAQCMCDCLYPLKLIHKFSFA